MTLLIETLAFLCVTQISLPTYPCTVLSSAPSYTAIVPHFLQPQYALPHTVVVILLDWKRPRTFLEELNTWPNWIEGRVQDDDTRKLEVTREEHRERCESISFSALSKLTLNFTLNHPPSRFLRPVVLSEVRFSRYTERRSHRDTTLPADLSSSRAPRRVLYQPFLRRHVWDGWYGWWGREGRRIGAQRRNLKILHKI